MQYLGGKHTLARKFAPILRDACARLPRFVEPFVGGFNLVPELAGVKLESIRCSDLHPGLQVLYEAVRDGWLPPANLSEFRYRHLRATCDWSKPEHAFAAFGCSFGGKEWGGYARNNKGGDYIGWAQRSLLHKVQAMQTVQFQTCNYKDLVIDKPSVVYCDPPYVGTTSYSKAIDRAEFFSWCERLAEQSCEVYISEFELPANWEIVWRHERSLNMGSREKKTELLAKLAR